MTLPFKPHILALLCSAGLLAAAGTLYVKSHAAETPPAPAPVRSTGHACTRSGSCQRTASCRHLYCRANRSVGRPCCALSGQPALAGIDGFNLSEQRFAGRAVVAG